MPAAGGTVNLIDPIKPFQGNGPKLRKLLIRKPFVVG